MEAKTRKSTLKIQGTNSAFPGCCGATVLHGLGASDLPGVSHAPKTESAQFATTVERQDDEIKALRAAKFIPLATWRNINSGNMVTLWGRGVEKV